MRNALTTSLGLLLLVSTAFFAEPPDKNAEEVQMGHEIQQVVATQEPTAPSQR